MSRRSKKKRNNKFLSIVFYILLAYFIYYVQEEYIKLNKNEEVEYYDFENIPDYNGEAYIYINNNEPFFNEEDITVDNFEYYSDLDELGRCGVVYANISKYSMPTEDRESIGNIQPSGWQTIKYDIVSGKYLYNRCHLIGYQLTGENDNENNLITCTRYMNATTMLKFENEVASYVDETGNHVLYRVTPYFKDDNLVVTGVMVEAYSVEDNGEGLKFNVFIYNVQPGIIIDYKTGDSKEEKSD